VLAHTVSRGVVRVRGWGFTMDAPVTVHYHHRLVKRVRADHQGSLAVSFRVPVRAHPRYYVVVTDSEDNYGSFSGLARAGA
jgi:hypothetical protein